jgi:hypothetical protein
MMVACAVLPIVRPSIAPAARAVIAGECALHPLVEHAFECGWDEASRSITTARLTCRGTPQSVSVFPTDMKPGCVHLHTHPIGPVMLSEGDQRALDALAPLGIGYAITNNDATELLLAREPRLPWQFNEPKPAVRSRAWIVGRFLLSLSYLPTLKPKENT